MLGEEDGIVAWPQRYAGQGLAVDDVDDGKMPDISLKHVDMKYKGAIGAELDQLLPNGNRSSSIDYDLLFENPKGEVERVVLGVTVEFCLLLLALAHLRSTPLPYLHPSPSLRQCINSSTHPLPLPLPLSLSPPPSLLTCSTAKGQGERSAGRILQDAHVRRIPC
eukprot:757162-Hanusia_phi.AAC.4